MINLLILAEGLSISPRLPNVKEVAVEVFMSKSSILYFRSNNKDIAKVILPLDDRVISQEVIRSLKTMLGDDIMQRVFYVDVGAPSVQMAAIQIAFYDDRVAKPTNGFNRDELLQSLEDAGVLMCSK